MENDVQTPHVGDKIDFPYVECDIVVDDVPARQPLSQDGIFLVGDQYGELLLCEREGDGWIVVRPDMLALRQTNRL